MGIPGLVTNKHVIDDAKWGSFFINKKRADKECSFGDMVEIKFERKDWIDHHNPSIDLSVLPLGPKVEEIVLRVRTKAYQEVNLPLIDSSITRYM